MKRSKYRAGGGAMKGSKMRAGGGAMKKSKSMAKMRMGGGIPIGDRSGAGKIIATPGRPKLPVGKMSPGGSLMMQKGGRVAQQERSALNVGNMPASVESALMGGGSRNVGQQAVLRGAKMRAGGGAMRGAKMRAGGGAMRGSKMRAGGGAMKGAKYRSKGGGLYGK